VNILIKNIKIFDVESQYHDSVLDILIENGYIKSISEGIERKEAELIDGKGMFISPSFVDMGAFIFDPGQEYKDTIESSLNAAFESGISILCMYPNTTPAVDSKSVVEYINSKSISNVNEILPYGSVSKGCEGEALAEMHDLYSVGVQAFTDGQNPIINSELLLKSLQYVQKFDGLIINKPQDPYLSMYGQMHEGNYSTRLGMQGIPTISETLMLQRDISILEYSGGRLHVNGVSGLESLEMIRNAKNQGLRITCDVAISNLLFTDESIENFDTNYKVSPPLRSKEDKEALIKGLIDGTIDAIISNSCSQDVESKKLEFEMAENGMLTLQTFFPMLLKISEKVDWAILHEKVATLPRKILNLEKISIEVGSKANLSIFDDKIKWEFNARSNKSNVTNSPYWDQKLTGKCIGMINNGVLKLVEG